MPVLRIMFAAGIALHAFSRGPHACALSAEPLASDASRSASRLVHHFDFDEQDEGNLEVLPRYWSPLHGGSFPRFTRAGFDATVGRASAPSLRIESLGRNAACQYDGPEIPVHAHSQYRIEGFLRTQHMDAARVCVSAHFLDAQRRPILETTTRTSYIAPQSEAEWTHFELLLPGASNDARFVGMIVWILQDATWNDAAGPRVSMTDVRATAWFDDVSVFRLPKVEIATRAPGNVLHGEGANALWVTLADMADQDVFAELTVTSADGATVMQRSLHATGKERSPLEISLSSLEPGLYDARIDIREHAALVVSRGVRFLKMGPPPGANRHARAFGMVLEHNARARLHEEAELLKNQPARCVKIPVWPVPDPRRPGTVGRELDRYYQDLVREQFLITGSFCGSPTQKTQSLNPDDGLVALFTGPRESWEESVASVAALAASHFRWWQFGGDDGAAPVHNPQIQDALKFLREALRQYITEPRLSLSMGASDQISGVPLPVEQVCLTVETSSDLRDLAEKIKTLRDGGREEVSVFVPPLSALQFDRQGRLAEWSKRILEARHAGADVVYIPQPWQMTTTPCGSDVAPTEEYLVLRTIASLLGDAHPGPIMPLKDRQVRCLAFRGADRAVLAVWDEAPPPGGRTVAVPLGTANRQVDLWGRATALERDSVGRQLVRVSSSPVFIDQIDPWIMDLAASFSIEPDVVESGTDLIRQELVMNCHGFSSLGGNGLIVPPSGMEVWPRMFTISACDGQVLRIPIQVRYGHNEPAGQKLFVVRLMSESAACTFEIPISVTVQMRDIDVRGKAVVDGGDLLLRHTLRNQSDHVVSFRSIAGVPGRQRQYRPIPNLGPGQTQTIEYRFRDAENLVGREINLSLRELNDGPRQHNLELIVP